METLPAKTTEMTRDCAALSARIDALGKILDEREERTKDRLSAMDRMTQNAFASAEKAIEKADQANQRHFNQVNEFRASLEDQTQKYLERTVYDVQHTNLSNRLDALTTKVNDIEKQIGSIIAANNSQSRITQLIIGGIIALATPAVAVIIYLLEKH